MKDVIDGFLANGYAKRIKRLEGKIRSPTMAEVIGGIIAEDQERWELTYKAECQAQGIKEN